LGTLRIGHGFALVKNPSLLELIRQKNICIEVNPVSNQVTKSWLKSEIDIYKIIFFTKILKLVDDMRNHPGSVFFSDNYPVVISSDDPSFWEATPLSHDFYEAFLGIASAHHDLRVLKKLAQNSLVYSSMNETELVVAQLKWTEHWDKFISDINNPNENGSA
jgi:adenosine deaminase CECR1